MDELHPISPIPAAPPLVGVEPHSTSREAFKKCFEHVTKGSGAGVVGTTFENWSAIYANGGSDDLFSLVSSINAGRASDECASAHGVRARMGSV